jgi:hypothetical protein
VAKTDDDTGDGAHGSFGATIHSPVRRASDAHFRWNHARAPRTTTGSSAPLSRTCRACSRVALLPAWTGSAHHSQGNTCSVMARPYRSLPHPVEGRERRDRSALGRALRAVQNSMSGASASSTSSGSARAASTHSTIAGISMIVAQ